MKRIFFILFTTALLSSCGKEKKCWIVTDCMGNDLYSYCSSENEIKQHIQTNQPPGCTWSYRPE